MRNGNVCRYHEYMSHDELMRVLRKAVFELGGIAPVARKLGMSRNAVTGVLAGNARAGTVQLAIERVRVAGME